MVSPQLTSEPVIAWQQTQIMKRSLSVLLIALGLTLSGCINLSFGSKRNPPPPEAPQVVIHTGPVTSADTANMAEIDAAARLQFDPARQDSLARIAQRSGLSPAVQVHLVHVAYRSLSFDEAKVQLLGTLIANPAFSDAARQAIVRQLDRLAFDNHKQEILRQLNQRVTVPS
jgi:hypothetical protein